MHFDDTEIARGLVNLRILSCSEGENLLVEKLFQALSPLLYELIIKYSVVTSEGELPDQSFSGERWDHHLQQGMKKFRQQN